MNTQVCPIIPIWMDQIKYIYLCITNHIQKISFIFQLIPQIWWTFCFASHWTYLTNRTQNDRIYFYLPWMPNHKQKPTSKVLLKMKLSRYFASFWVITEEPDRTLLTWPYQFIVSMTAKSHAKIELYTSTFLYHSLKNSAFWLV